MIHTKIFSEKNLSITAQLLVVFLSLNSHYACSKKTETVPQFEYLERAEIISKFPKEILSMARFVDYFYGGIKVTEIKSGKNPSNNKLQYEILVNTTHRADIKKSLHAIFKDYVKHLDIKYPGFTFQENTPESKIIVIPD